MLTVALVFLVTWVIPNQIAIVLFIKFPDTDDGAVLKLRATTLLGAFEEQSFSTAKCLAATTAQLNSCINFFIYALRHAKFREHLRLMCGADKDSSKTTTAALNAKVGT